jgi:uncharacterized protein with gpF-like domain
MLEYVSRKDSKVRPNHKRADGVILDSKNPWWLTAQHLLSDWNCRCQIVKASSNQEQFTINQANIPKPVEKANSKIDLRSEKVIVFQEHLSLFDVPTSIKRKYYRPNGF